MATRSVVLGLSLVLAAAGAFSNGACSNEVVVVTPPPAEPEGTSVDLPDVPVAGVSEELARQFAEGDGLFDLPLRVADGLGPLYTQDHCSGCHKSAGRGPGLVQKMSVVNADGVPEPDQSKLPYGDTVHPLLAGGGKTPIAAPDGDPSIRVTTRLGPPVLGRGYMEAVADAEILRVEAEQANRSDGIRGRVNWVVYASEANEDTSFHTHKKGDRVIGRFGLKARIATLDDFTADAFQGDMGITSPLRPVEFKNPDGLTDDGKPGVDVGFGSVNKRAMYSRLLAIPKRRPLTGLASSVAPAKLFENAQCAACHVPTLHTRADYPIAVLANVDAAVYTDFLLHDMGSDLADAARPGSDGTATYREWRTAPLIGLRFNRSYMHDGRAKTIREAILSHRGKGSQGNGSVDLFEGFSAADQQALEAYVLSL